MTTAENAIPPNWGDVSPAFHTFFKAAAAMDKVIENEPDRYRIHKRGSQFFVQFDNANREAK